MNGLNPLLPAWMERSPIVQQKLYLLIPEITVILVLLAGLILLMTLKTEKEREESLWTVSVMGCFLTLFLLVWQFTNDYTETGLSLQRSFSDYRWLNESVCYGMFKADLFSVVVRIFLVLGTMFSAAFSRHYIKDRAEISGEYYVVMLCALLGGMFLAGANNLIMMFVALETLGISSYILVGYFRKDRASTEAALKYLVYGGAATAVLLFGSSLVYGLTGFTEFGAIANRLALQEHNHFLYALAGVLIFSGFCFKLSAAPFHMWTPDVYEGAPTPVTAFLSVVSKMAGFAIAMRFVFAVMSQLGQETAWFGLIAGLSVVSMTIGNFVALKQTNIKRLLAYSTIAHAGYILLGFAVMNVEGLSSVLFYLVTYLFMNLGAFAVVILFSEQTGSDEIASYAGLVRKRPILTLSFSILLLSLAGMPITAGFFGKFFVFQALAKLGSQHLWLVMLALLNSTVSLYYYLNIMRLMVIAEPSKEVEKLPAQTAGSLLDRFTPVNAVIMVCVYFTCLLGFMAEPSMSLARASMMEMQTAARMYVPQVQKAEKPVQPVQKSKLTSMVHQ